MTSNDKNKQASVKTERKKPPADLGTTLRQAREKEAMSVSQLASELFLPVSTIEALENNSFDSLPEPAYIRGYIRNYAKATKLDASLLDQQFNALNLQTPEFRPTLRHKTDSGLPFISVRSARPVMWSASIVLMVAMVWWSLQPGQESDWLLQISEDETPATEKLLFEAEKLNTAPVKYQTFDEPAEAVSVAELSLDSTAEAPESQLASDAEVEKVLAELESNAGATRTEASKPRQETIPTTSNHTASEQQDAPVGNSRFTEDALPEITEQPTLSFAQSVSELSPTEEIDDLVSVEVIGSSNTSRVPEYGRDRLQLRYNNQSWTEIRDAENKVLLHGLVRTGETRTLEGKAPFNVFLGNSPAVDLVINGLPFDQTDFNRSNKTARFSVIEPAL